MKHYLGILAWACSSPLMGQMTPLEAFLEEQVVLGFWTPHEAMSVIHHIAIFGLPVIPQEAGAIRGLRPASIVALRNESSWKFLCSGVLGLVKSKPVQLVGSWTGRLVTPGVDMAEGNLMSHSFRFRKQGHWALRIDRGLASNCFDHIAGFLIFQDVRKKSILVVGDHILRWGLGLNVWDQDFFTGMNTSVEILPSNHWLTPAWGSASSQHRSGIGKTREIRDFRLVSSISVAGHVLDEEPLNPVQWRDMSWLEARSAEGVRRIRELRLAQLIRYRLSRGSVALIGEGGAFLQRDSLKNPFAWLGVHAQGFGNNFRWALETRHFKKEHAVQITGLKNIGRNWDVYFSLERQAKTHPAWRWNDPRISPRTQLIFGGQKLRYGEIGWSGTWRIERDISAEDSTDKTMRFKWKWLISRNDMNQFQWKFQRDVFSDHHGWLDPNWRHSLRWEKSREAMKIRIQTSIASRVGTFDNLGLGVLLWMEGKQKQWRWKLAASSWRVQEGGRIYMAQPRLHGAGSQVMTGVGSRFSWWFGGQFNQTFSLHCAGHAMIRSDRLSNSYLGFSTMGPVQTGIDFRLTVSL